MKVSSLLTLSCLCAATYAGNAAAADTSAEGTESVEPSASAVLPGEAGQAKSEEATMDNAAESEDESAAAEREAKNAIYLDLLGPGLIYSINYDRVITGDLSARIGLSYLSLGASTDDAEVGFSYLAVPLTVSYLGIGSENNMLEVGGGLVLMSVKGSGLVDAGESSGSVEASATLLSATGIVGYRHQPADGGFVFRVGLSPLMTFGDGFLPWGYLSLGAAF